MQRRGQSAMEFLMTYGWAILVVIVVLSALYFLGVFSQKTSSICSIQAPFVCKDFQAKENGVLLAVGVSNLVQSGVVDSITINGGECSVVNSNLKSNQINEVKCLGVNLDEVNKISVNMEIRYTSKSGLDHSLVGSGSGNRENGVITRVDISEDDALLFDFEDVGYPPFINNLIGNNDGRCNEDCPVQIINDRIGGKAFYFDGINDGVRVDNSEILNPGDESFSIGIWFNTSGFDSTRTLFIKQGGWNINGYRLQMTPAGQLQFRFTDGTDNCKKTVGSLGGLNDRAWHYFVVVIDRDEGKIKLYNNGNIMPSNPDQANIASCGVIINNEDLYVGPGDAFFMGAIDEFYIWDRALSPEEIMNFYNIYLG